MNGDGFQDVAVGALFVNNSAGKVAVFYGKPDMGGPVASPALAGPLGLNDWYTGHVTVNWNWVGGTAGSAVDSAACTATTVVSGEGILNPAAACKNVAGTEANASLPVQIDRGAPVFGPCPMLNTFSWNTGVWTIWPLDVFEAVSGLNGPVYQSLDAIDTSTVGAQTVTFRATDNAGYTAEQTCTYTVVNDPPTFWVRPGGACLGDGGAAGQINLWVDDPNTSDDLLTLRVVSSSNPALVPAGAVQFGGSFNERTLTVTPTPKKSGTARLIIGVSDGVNTTTLPIQVLVGTDKGDTLNGSAATDILFGLGGEDKLNGGAGNDLLCGGNGEDRLSGGDNEDTLDGGRGEDILKGESGDDTLTGGPGADRFSGGDYWDTATDFNPREGDKQDGTVEAGVPVAAAAAVPQITNWLFLPSVENDR